jgi:SRSO17 transposase
VAELKKVEQELGRSERRYWCKLYLTGLLLDGERKSIEPMAHRVPGGNKQALQQFVNQSPWAHEPGQDKLSQHLVPGSGTGRGVLVLDATTLPKKGDASVGVARQYCGAVGKVTNCQAIVTWHYCGPDLHFPLLGEVYLPQSWTTDPARLERAGIPEDEWAFREKWKLALALLDRVNDDLSYEAIVIDAGYGELLGPSSTPLTNANSALSPRFPNPIVFGPLPLPLRSA